MLNDANTDNGRRLKAIFFNKLILPFGLRATWSGVRQDTQAFWTRSLATKPAGALTRMR